MGIVVMGPVLPRNSRSQQRKALLYASAMSDDRDGFGTNVLKFGAGLGIGFALYMMFGGNLGLGFGRGAGGSGSGGGGMQPPRDAQPITARVIPDPADASKAVIDLEGQHVSVADLIGRVVAGGRHDVVLLIRGDVREGAAEQVRQTITSSGLQIVARLASSTPSTPPSPRSDPWA
jgi:hypothetical protein